MERVGSVVEFVLFGVAVIAALVLLRSLRRWVAGLTLVLAIAAAACWHLAGAGDRASRAVLLASAPDPALPGERFVTSSTCRACHPEQYASWHGSYHRTMTQLATPRSVVGDFGDVWLHNRGRDYRLYRRGDEFWVEMVDPEWEHDLVAQRIDPGRVQEAPRTWKRVVMTTGSHHMQTCWVAGTRDGRLYNVPFVWLIDDQRWVPREDVFLRPPDFPRQFGTWHDNCIECHAVAGEPNRDPASGRFDPHVAELGIACEACHGPAETHVTVNRNPARRYQARLDEQSDPTIVNPERLAARRASQVCGQCHGMNLFKTRELIEGARYRAGGDLTETRLILRSSDRAMPPDERHEWPRIERHVAAQPDTFLDERYWSDGMVRVSGREHNAMIESACFMGGELSCLSCHSMHDSDPVDQLAAEMDTDAACLGCHAAIAADPVAHTHHPETSAGARCYNCHMPRTTYGLLKAIRSHLIDSPSVADSLETGRPNACTLCHLDRTLEWSAEHLERWYGQATADLPPWARRRSAALEWLLTGDAGQRALIAWHMGWAPAQEASGRDWMAPFLGQLLDDPYSCVRYIAHRSLRGLPGFEDFHYDFVGPPESRRAARGRALARWHAIKPAALDRCGPELLVDRRGALDAEALAALVAMRDDRPVDLRE